MWGKKPLPKKITVIFTFIPSSLYTIKVGLIENKYKVLIDTDRERERSQIVDISEIFKICEIVVIFEKAYRYLR